MPRYDDHSMPTYRAMSPEGLVQFDTMTQFLDSLPDQEDFVLRECADKLHYGCRYYFAEPGHFGFEYVEPVYHA